MAKILIKHLKQAEHIIRTRGYDHSTYGRVGECECVLGAIAEAAIPVQEGETNHGSEALDFLRESPLRSFRKTLAMLKDHKASVSQKQALAILRRFIAALRRNIHAAH